MSSLRVCLLRSLVLTSVTEPLHVSLEPVPMHVGWLQGKQACGPSSFRGGHGLSLPLPKLTSGYALIIGTVFSCIAAKK